MDAAQLTPQMLQQNNTLQLILVVLMFCLLVVLIWMTWRNAASEKKKSEADAKLQQNIEGYTNGLKDIGNQLAHLVHHNNTDHDGFNKKIKNHADILERHGELLQEHEDILRPRKVAVRKKINNNTVGNGMA